MCFTPFSRCSTIDVCLSISVCTKISTYALSQGTITLKDPCVCRRDVRSTTKLRTEIFTTHENPNLHTDTSVAILNKYLIVLFIKSMAVPAESIGASSTSSFFGPIRQHLSKRQTYLALKTFRELPELSSNDCRQFLLDPLSAVREWWHSKGGHETVIGLLTNHHLICDGWIALLAFLPSEDLWKLKEKMRNRNIVIHFMRLAT